MDKLYSEEQIKEWASKRADDAGRLSRQLLDTMHENERLKFDLQRACCIRDAYKDLYEQHSVTCSNMNGRKIPPLTAPDGAKVVYRYKDSKGRYKTSE